MTAIDVSTNEGEMSAEGSLRYPGWQVVAAAFVGVMVSFAAIVPYTFSLFLEPLHSAFGWQREAISNAFAIAAITVALLSPGIGLLLDRLPPRRIILPSVLVFAATLASLSRLTPRLSHLYLCFFLRRWANTWPSMAMSGPRNRPPKSIARENIPRAINPAVDGKPQQH